MADIDRLKICINRDECIGDGACVNEAAETFDLDDEMRAFVKLGSTDDREAILAAAESCPLDIIEVVDKVTGEKLYPKD
jgi:ferredoxin